MNCPICLLTVADGLPHMACRIELFGEPIDLTLRFSSDDLVPLIRQVADEMSISGFQSKLSLRVVDGQLDSVAKGGTHILKPGTRWAELPALEHVTLLLAQRLGFDVPQCATLRLADGVDAFLIRRFDRTLDAYQAPKKLRVEDFCQLLTRPPDDKDKSSAEQIAKAVRDHFEDVDGGLSELFRRMVLIWWTGSGDMHLKNFSVFMNDGERARWTPIYDLHNTSLLTEFGREPLNARYNALMLPIDGTKTPRHHTWNGFARRCHLDMAQARQLIESVADNLVLAEQTIESSALPPPWKAAYIALLRARRESFAARQNR